MRLAPLLRTRLSRAPMAVMITATIWLSPSALAEVKNPNNKSLKLQSQTMNANSPKEKAYSKDELKQKKPQPAVTMGDEVGSQVISLINSIGNSKDLGKHKSSVQSKHTYFERASFSLDNSNNTAANPDNVRKQINTDATKVVQKRTIEQTEIWRRLSGGFDFKLDFGKIFGRKAKEKAAPEQSKGKVRYGLVLKNVTPDADPNKQRAAIGSEDELQFAGTAEVEWTIGPIYDDDNGDKTVFQSNSDIYSTATTARKNNSAGQQNSDEEGDLWDQISVPSPEFAVSVRPEDTDTVKGFFQKNETPGMKITLTQVQNLYQLSTLTPNKTKKRAVNESEHSFNLPIYGATSVSRTYKSVGRRLTDKMEMTRTSFNNVLLSKKYPSLSFHIDHLTDQQSSDMKIAHSSGEYSLVARTNAKKATDEEKLKDRNLNKTYEVGYKKSF